MNCDDFDITQFVTTSKDMQKLVDNQNYMIRKVFKTHWSLALRTLSEIEEVHVSVRNKEEWQGQRILLNNCDISQSQIEELVKKEQARNYHIGEWLITKIENFGEFIGCYRKKTKEYAIFVKVDIVSLDWIVDQ